MNWLSSSRLRTMLLPLLLSAATVLGLGSYTETSDDQTLAWLFSGVLALKPVPSVPLYLHGYGHLLAAAYAAVPAGPWLGLLLGTLLAGATAMFFAVLDQLLRPHLRPGPLALVLMLFFWLAWLEHWLWFSHGRVALLLAGAGMLFAAQRAGRRRALLLGLLALGAAWLVRPGLAVLGATAVVPAALLLAGSWKRAGPVLGSAALGLALATGILHWQQTPVEAATQQRDATFSRILDFDQFHPQPRTPVDSLGTAAVGLWLFGDSTVVNEGLFRRAYRFDAAQFFGREVPAKLRLRLGLLGRDYFPLLLALVVISGQVRRRRGRIAGFWLVQAAFVGGLILLAGLLKLPPRLALALLDFWLLTNVIFWLKARENDETGEGSAENGYRARGTISPLARGVGVAAVLAVIGLYGAKTWHRHQVLSQEQQRHEKTLDDIAYHRDARRVRILAGTNDLLKSLSPFRSYNFMRQPVLLLTGWSSHDASQVALRRALSGTTDQTECLRRLAQLETYGSEAEVLWVLTPETARWLSRRFRSGGVRLHLVPTAPPLPGTLTSGVRVYRTDNRDFGTI
ncbi:hypothetical protein [Hymenobacter negativus]|uniref:Glycosyltransferase RgtA/B/C/D-like domain-containing protein n=1 Tax=Hymenobacter negativus TaxID=2795026 RepID=A0ABS3QNH4_9BACT|nr:hypothetical protein [Hymenobacter negativus]MBO2012791.1 hypothetical protein [Hymenobacter negativus]